MPITVQKFCDSNGISLNEFGRGVTDFLLPEILGNEVYSRADVEALLAQPNAMAMRPVNFNNVTTNVNTTLLVGVFENIPLLNPNNPDGAEFKNMIEADHLLAIPQTTL